MHNPMSEDAILAASFGRRKVVARACVVDGKLHIRDFLREALEEIGFIAHACEDERGLSQTVVEQQSDLVVLGLLGGGIAANAQLDLLHEMSFQGPVLVFLDNRYVGAGKFNTTYVQGVDVSNNHIPSVDYWDTRVDYTLPGDLANFDVYVGINNLLNQKPPLDPGGSALFQQYTNVSFYDVIGRFFRVGVKVDY